MDLSCFILNFIVKMIAQSFVENNMIVSVIMGTIVKKIRKIIKKSDMLSKQKNVSYPYPLIY